MLSRTVYLINDDDPGQFAPRAATILPDEIRIEGRELVPVSISPPIENVGGDPLSFALLVPRSRWTSIAELRHGPMAKPTRVFVYRIKGDGPPLDRTLTLADVSVALWGLVGESMDALGRRR
jgi:hypothetical protein